MAAKNKKDNESGNRILRNVIFEDGRMNCGLYTISIEKALLELGIKGGLSGNFITIE